MNVYEGDRPVCQCHNVEDAKCIVVAVNKAMKTVVDDQLPNLKKALDLLRQVNGANNREEEQPEVYKLDAVAASHYAADRAIAKLNEQGLMTLVDGCEDEVMQLLASNVELVDAYKILLAYFEAGMPCE